MKLSIVTVTYNAAATIEQTIRSVAAQDWPDYEHLIIDGASKDDTVARAQALAHQRLTIISEPDRGLYDAMNKGLRAARGDLIGFLNADDFYCRTDALSQVAAAAEATAREAVCGDIVIVDADDPAKVLRKYPARGFRPWMLRLGHMPPHPGFFVRRRVVEEIGEFDLAYKTAADLDWMVRFFLVQRFEVEPIASTLTAMRAGGQSQSVKGMLLSRRESSHSLERHGFGGAWLWARYLLKAPGFLARGDAFPVPDALRWPAGAGGRVTNSSPAGARVAPRLT
jgi:glycosyltransferase involved in cell wall biosynthesis